MARRFVDLSHPVENGMDAYPGLPAPRIEAHLDHDASRPHYDGKAGFYIGRVEMVGNVGTYIDSPFHRFPGREDLSRLPLERIASVPGLVADAIIAADRSVTIAQDDAALAGRAVLVRSGWDRRWGRAEYWEPGPYLSDALVTRLIEAGAALVGVDFWNVDDTENPARPAHTRLLEAGLPIVEHMCNLDALPETGFRFTAAPPPIAGGASFPVRAFAEIEAD